MGNRLVRSAWLVAFAILLTLGHAPEQAAAVEQRVYVRGIPDRATFEAYSKEVGADRFVKFIIDVKTDDIYFIDVNLFKLHADFVLGVLLKQEWTAENIREYNKNYERKKPRFILGYITEHQTAEKMTFSFWEGDKIDAKGVRRVHKRLRESFWKAKVLEFRPDSVAQEKVARKVARRGIPVITNDQLYRETPYHAFHTGSAVGKLRVVPKGTAYEDLLFDHHDIVLIQETYPDISPVAGLLTTEFSTPLSHLNLRATAWDIPNARLVDAADQYQSLDGKTVFYEVADAKITLRSATSREIEQFRQQEAARRSVEIPTANLRSRALPMLGDPGATHARRVGAKCANLAEVANRRLSGVNIPRGFCVPFSFYVRHMRQHRLDRKLSALLADSRFETSAAWRKAELARLRQAIVDAPIDSGTIDAIYQRVQDRLGGAGVFVRSSTNAEDLTGFNGAGLYDTVPNVRGKKAIAAAMKQVWASLWNYRAVEERSLYGIDHTKVFPAVLVQIGVNASAAGVLITKNLFDPEETGSYTINAKWGLGIRVVEGARIPEQVIFDTTNDGTKIISRSDDPVMLVFDENGGIREVPNPHRGVILTEKRAKRLADAVTAFAYYFPKGQTLDVEWLLEGEKVWIVQVRPYVGR